MKISPAVVRRSRIERGWSQEQLAMVSGLSLRTVQRMEAEGIASLSTATSLAATYGIPLIELQEASGLPEARQDLALHGALFLGLAILMLAAMAESGRLPDESRSAGFVAITTLVAAAGALLLLPAAKRILRARQYVGAGLAVVGTPLATLLVGGFIASVVSGRPPLWQLLGMGATGVALIVMAARELRRGCSHDRTRQFRQAVRDAA